MLKLSTELAKKLKIKINIPKKISKWRNKPDFEDGYRFGSHLEGNYYRYLKLQRMLGDVVFFLRQVPIHLSPEKKYICNFLVFYSNGTYEFINVQEKETKGFLIKKSWTEKDYPIKLRIIKKGEF